MSRLSFAVKWNLRDVARSKARTIMGIVGVAGSTLLIVMAYGMEDSILSGLGRVQNELSSVESYSDNIKAMSSETNEAYYCLQDIAERLRDIESSLSFSEADMDQVSERLSIIEDAKRK